MDSGASVGDLAAFEALPEEVQALARRVLADDFEDYNEPGDDPVSMYLRGFGDASAQVGNTIPLPTRKQVLERISE